MKELGLGADLELAVDVALVIDDSAFRNIELMGDRFGRVALDGEFDYIDFARE